MPIKPLFISLITPILAFGISNVCLAGVPTLQPGATFDDCLQCPQMTVIPPGQFLMGLTKEEAERQLQLVPPHERTAFIPSITIGVQDYMEQEMPQHPVHIDYTFSLSTYPITRGEFADFVKETKYSPQQTCTLHRNHHYQNVVGSNWQNPGFSQTDNEPVVCVNKTDAEAYIAWLNTKAQAKTSAKDTAMYRLPSEAEWEYAARAGTKTSYWWGDTVGSNNSVCNACGNRWDNKKTAPVDGFQANPFGLYDMLGNVWELTADCWSKSFSDSPTDGSAVNIANCQKYVMRGGDWGNDPWTLRSTTRARTTADERNNYQGFRVARMILD